MAKKQTEPKQTELMPLPSVENLTGGQTTMPIDVKSIEASPFQPRDVSEGEAFDELVESIRTDGLRHPVRVRRKSKNGKVQGGKFELVYGHRRFAAVKKLGLDSIPAEIVTIDDSDVVREQLIENLMREGLTPLEEAQQFNLAIDRLGLKPETLAPMLRPRRSPSYIRDRLRLLNLPQAVREAVAGEDIRPNQAKLVEMLAPWPEVQKDLLEQLAERGPVTDQQLKEAVERVYRSNTVSLDDRTPFDWKTECKKAGCLSKGPEGEVCTDPAMYMQNVVATHKDSMAEKIEAYKAKNDVVGLPVFYDLRGVDPMRHVYSYESAPVPGFPACPVTVTNNRWSTGEAMTWSEHIVQVADKEACRMCPGYNVIDGVRNEPKQGRALLVVVNDRQLGKEVEVTPLCMVSSCREKKHKEGLTAREQKDRDKAKETEGKQEGIIAGVTAAADKLAKRRLQLLAVLLTQRNGTKSQAEPKHTSEKAMGRLAISMPIVGDTLDAQIRSLMALGEETLLRIHAQSVIAEYDRALDWSGKWMPNRIGATLGLLGLDSIESDLEASVAAAETAAAKVTPITKASDRKGKVEKKTD